MSAGFTDKAGALTIPNGDTVSNALPKITYEDAANLLLIAPSSLNTASGFSIQIAETTAGPWRTFQRDNVGTLYNAPVPGASLASAYPELVAAGAIRLACSGAPNADTTFLLYKNWVSP